MRIAIATAVACFIVTGMSAAQESNAAIKHYELNIPRQSLDGALKDFAHQTGLQIARFSDTVDGSLEVGPVTGNLSAEQALTSLLSSRGLAYTLVNDRTVAVISATSSSNTFPAPARADTNSAAARYQTAAPESDKKSFWDRFRLAQADQGKNASDAPVEDSRTASEDKPARYMEEVIVTAQRRAENIQDVPISIAVVTADDIDRRGLVNSEDYLRGIPGVIQSEDKGSGQTIIIRGIETQSSLQNARSGPTTATYFGETPTTTSAGGNGGSSVDIKLVDVERVEVLRGPQGTAFGSSSIGGAVRVIPAAPKLDDFDGKVAIGYSLTSGTGGDNYNVQAVGNVPLIRDKLAIRATGYQYQDSGYYRNVAGSDAVFRAVAVTPYALESFAVDQEEVGSYYVRGGRIGALFQASDDLRFTLSYLRQKTEADGFATANNGTYEQTMLQVPVEDSFRGEHGAVNDTDIEIANAIIEYDLGWANLLGTYSHLESGTSVSYVYTVILPWPLAAVSDSDHRENVGEVRLVTQLDGAWNFVAGLYSEDVEEVGESHSHWYSSPATLLSFFPPNITRSEGRGRADLKQDAAFGEASWEFLPGFTLTGGVRAYDYKRSNQGESTAGIFSGPTPSTTSGGSEASGTIFRGNLSYKLGDDTLLYAGWSQGFRLGKPQGGLPVSFCDVNGDGIVDGNNVTIEETRSTTSDNADSYEIGGKFSLLDRRLTIAADVFRMDWSNIPATVSINCNGINFPYLANVGAALSEGIEFQANFDVTEALRVDVGGSWIDPKLTEDAPLQGFFSGMRLPGSPRVSGNLGLQYEFDIGGHKAYVRTDSTYIGPFHGDLRETPLTKTDSHVKLNASARVTIKNLNIDLFVRNLTNDDAYTFRGAFPRTSYGRENYGYRLRPRTIGLQLGFTF